MGIFRLNYLYCNEFNAFIKFKIVIQLQAQYIAREAWV